MRISDISISPDIARFREAYRASLLSGHRRIDHVVGYLTRTHGKGIRPTLVLLSARLGGNGVGDDAIRAAVIVELLHEATLIHDDVVDEAKERRMMPSLPAKFRNKVAVLFGDYMLAKVLSETLTARNLDWLDILAETSRRMARGELLQAVKSRKLDLTVEEYQSLIADKTAALFSACCRLGALSGGLGGDTVTKLGAYGEHLGIAFQISDDLLDLFGDGHMLGKPTGGDLKQRKLTLPLLAAMTNAAPRDARRVRARIRRGIRAREVRLIKDFVRDHNGDTNAAKLMRHHVEAALQELTNLPTSDAKHSLIELPNFVTMRKL